MVSLRRRASAYRPTGVECHLLEPDQIKEKHPLVNTEDVIGGVWMPNDATVDAGKVSEVFAYIASQGGAKFVSGCGVQKVLTSKEPVAVTVSG